MNALYVSAAWFIQGHLEEGQVYYGEPGCIVPIALYHLFHVGYLPPFIRDKLIKVLEIYCKSSPVGWFVY